MRYAWLAVCVVACLTACHKQEKRAGAVCALSAAKWRLGSPEPPNQSILVQVSLSRNATMLNGRSETLGEIRYDLASLARLRPSPYLELISARDLSCRDVRKFANYLDEAFNCRQNYCFISRGLR